MNRKELETFIHDRYDTDGEYLWAKYPDYEVFRHSNNRKWFALIGTAPKEKLGLSEQGFLTVINLKCGPVAAGSLRMGEGVFPAYHMNKENWISVALDGSVPDDTIQALIDISFDATALKIRKRRTSKNNGAQRAMREQIGTDAEGCFADGKRRCNYSFGTVRYWNSKVFLEYHDTRWCKPKHDDHEIFAQLCLEMFASGLGWVLILEKEANFRSAFDDFVPEIVAAYTEEKIENLMKDAGIVRNRRKIEATINNAKAFLRIQQEFGSFDHYIWKFTDEEVVDHHLQSGKDMPTKTELSDVISKDLKKRGFKFIGSSTVYTFLQGIGIVNDHWEHCEFR